MSFQKCKPHIITYRIYKNYDNNVFRPEIESFCSLNETDLGLFKVSIFCIFNKYASIRKKYLRANEATFMTRELHNAIMKRSRYRNKFLKDKSQTSRETWNSNESICRVPIWRIHSRLTNNKINRIHEKALRLAYSDHVFSFDELLKKDQSFSIHNRNIQSLAIEV